MYGWNELKTHSIYADFFFQMVFVATAMSVVSGAVAERKKLWSFLVFAFVFTSIIYPCLLYTSPSPRDYAASRMPSSA